ncbi:IS66 family transposase [Aneurinibacillus tyrosinisolvens]|uniref:IS66 family transposase n=1 Tax=Aneurinibacillus tyrosinisolvens TaxID=1443435 RepID=UPI00063EE2AD
MLAKDLSHEELIQIVKRQAETIAARTARVAELEKQRNKNSSNRHRSPSSDGGVKKVHRTKSERPSTTRKTGGQPGHKGSHLPFSLHPDMEEIHSLSDCSSCGCSPVIHVDETGMDILPKRQWVHVYNTAEETYYSIHPKRGREAIEAIGLLLIEMKKQKERYQNMGLPPPREEMERLSAAYDELVSEGCEKNPMFYAEGTLKKKGSKKQSPARNMLDRLLLHRDKLLLFLHRLEVPFDNNQAERDLRMMRVKENISGVFRSSEGAQAFCQTRSFISTVRKKGLRVLSSLQQAVEGTFVFS